MNKSSICAIVVTYNRKELLIHCLNKLIEQDHPLDHIVVINNASTDGTIEFLTEHNWNTKDKFTLINLEKNQGGAGGFYEGIKFAYNNKFDYIWLMDDDGYPAKNCLSFLIKYINECSYIGPLVLNKDNPDELTFTMRLDKKHNIIQYKDDIKKFKFEQIIPNIVMPFNGILFSRKLVEKIGLPNKLYFIWGDDIEYTWRAKKAGFSIFTVPQAEFFHPKDPNLATPMFFNLLKFNDSSSELKLFCFARNNTRNLLDYKGPLLAILFIIKVTWFYLFTKHNLAKLRICYQGIFDGIMKNFKNHINFLKK